MAKNNSKNVRKDIDKLLTIIDKLKHNIGEISSWLHSQFDVLPSNIKGILSSCEELCCESFSDSQNILTVAQENSTTSEKVIGSPIKTCITGLEYNVIESNPENETTSMPFKEEDFGIKDEYLSGTDNDHDNDLLEGLCPYLSFDEKIFSRSEDELQLDKDIFDTDLKISCYQNMIEKFNLTKNLVIILEDINKCNNVKATIRSSTTTIERNVEKRKSDRKSKCSSCQKVFKTEIARKKHETKSHDKNKPFHCHYKKCHRAFLARGAFYSHMRNHHPEYYATVREEPFYKKDKISLDGHVCEKCRRSFCTLEECNNHVCRRKYKTKGKLLNQKPQPKARAAMVKNVTVTESQGVENNDGNSFVCPKCETNCPTREFLNEHIFNYCYKCKFCQRPFSLKNTRDEHLAHCKNKKDEKVQEVSKSLSCELCQTNYAEEKDFEYHLVTAHRVKTFNCVHIGCKKRFALETEVDQHESKLHCQTCSRSFPHLANFTIHNNKTHAGQASTSIIDKTNKPRDFENDFQCSKCGKLVTTFAQFKNHLEIGCLECKTCGKTFPSGINLELHLRTHTKEKAFLCNSCGKQFTRKSDLERHVRTQHEPNREKYKCTLCEKTFVTPVGYSRHMKTHDADGVPRILCNLCGFDFSSTRALSSHIQAVHENRRPYPCHLCDKRFKSTTARKYHVKTHENPNGRKRGLNKDLDIITVVGAKRRRKPPESERNAL